jgi:hypothetical protein
VRYLRWISYGITLSGLALIAVSLTFISSPTLTLIGMMMVIAGLVKIGAVGIWHGVGGFGVPLADPDESSSAEPNA